MGASSQVAWAGVRLLQLGQTNPAAFLRALKKSAPRFVPSGAPSDCALSQTWVNSYWSPGSFSENITGCQQLGLLLEKWDCPHRSSAGDSGRPGAKACLTPGEPQEGVSVDAE